MSNYRYAYENYYKNLNNKERDKQSNNYIPSRKKDTRSLYEGKNNEKYFTLNYWIERIIRQLIGALILLLVFVGLKYIKLNEVQNAYTWCKQCVTQKFNYNKTIDAFNTIEIGKFKTKDIKIGEFMVEDLKGENLKSKVESFGEYLKNINNLQR